MAKAEKAKAGQSSEQSAAAKQHAAEINARRRAEGKETRSTGSIARSQRRAQAHRAAKSKAAPATDRGRSRSPVREAAPKPAAASSSYEDTEEEAVAGEFLPAAPGLRQRLGHSSKSRLSPRFCQPQRQRPRH